MKPTEIITSNNSNHGLICFDDSLIIDGMKSGELIEFINMLKDFAIKNGYRDVIIDSDYDHYDFFAVK